MLQMSKLIGLMKFNPQELLHNKTRQLFDFYMVRRKDGFRVIRVVLMTAKPYRCRIIESFQDFNLSQVSGLRYSVYIVEDTLLPTRHI